MKEVEMKPLYGLTSKGKTKTWIVTVTEFDDGTATIDQKYGELDGKLQSNRKTVREGKNLGKKNATTAFQQATKEAESKYRKKLEQEGYSEDKDDLVIPMLPMLAKSFNDMKHKISYPCYVQPKLDGIRCFAKKINGDTIIYTSRKGKQFTTLEHLTPALLEIMQIDEIFDGEIYSHDLTFQEVTAAIKKQRENTLKLEFWIYDVADSEKDFQDRYSKYISTDNKPGLVQVDSYRADSEEDVRKSHDELVSRNFEGAIIRNMKGGYDLKKRSNNLQKLKSFIDKEFLVVGGYTGKGTSFEGSVTFECQAENGRIFGCVPKGPFSYKQELWQNLNKIVANKTMLTVRYFELTDDGVPRFPIGVSLRDYE